MEGYSHTQTDCVSPINIPTRANDMSLQQSLKQNFFDPSKESPVDDFTFPKLDVRFTRYYRPETQPFKFDSKQSIEKSR